MRIGLILARSFDNRFEMGRADRSGKVPRGLGRDARSVVSGRDAAARNQHRLHSPHRAERAGVPGVGSYRLSGRMLGGHRLHSASPARRDDCASQHLPGKPPLAWRHTNGRLTRAGLRRSHAAISRPPELVRAVDIDVSFEFQRESDADAGSAGLASGRPLEAGERRPSRVTIGDVSEMTGRFPPAVEPGPEATCDR